jgi:hypothetical protein
MYYYTYKSAIPNISARRHLTGGIKIQKVQKQIDILVVYVKTGHSHEKKEREKK